MHPNLIHMVGLVIVIFLLMSCVGLICFYSIIQNQEHMKNLFEQAFNELAGNLAEIRDDINFLKEEFERVQNEQGISQSDAQTLYARLVQLTAKSRTVADLIVTPTPPPPPGEEEEPTDPEGEE